MGLGRARFQDPSGGPGAGVQLGRGPVIRSQLLT
jgi:hypothetical protein